MNTRAMNLVGARFTRLAVVSITEERDSSGSAIWRCICACGNPCKASTKDLRRQHKKSCGCLKATATQANARRHGAASHVERSREYRSWSSMRTRCQNPKYHYFHRYGGRGVSICSRWNDFSAFLEDMGPRPEDTSLDRFPNPDGNYEPSNCRWATRAQQRNNRGS